MKTYQRFKKKTIRTVGSVAALLIFFAIIFGLVAHSKVQEKKPFLSPSREITSAKLKQSQRNLSPPFDALVSHDETPSTLPPLPPIPEKKLLSGGTHTYQTFNNCGPASLSMTLSYFDIHISQQTLGRQLRPHQNSQGNNDDKSVTLKEMAQRAQELGFVTYQRPAGDIELLQRFVAQNIPVITRTWLNENEDIGHYRVVKGYDVEKQILIQDDSLQGKDIEFSYAHFNKLWQAFNYEYLVLVPSEKQALAEQILGERLDVTRSWQRALELSIQESHNNPTNVYAQFNQAVAHYYLGNHAEAVAIFERISYQLPNRMLWYQVEPLLAYYQMKEYQTVLSLSEQILQSQNRAYSELHWLRGKVFEETGESTQAASSFELAKTYNSSNYWMANVE